MDHIDLDLAMTKMALCYSDHIIRPMRSMCRYGVLGHASYVQGWSHDAHRLMCQNIFLFQYFLHLNNVPQYQSSTTVQT